MQRCGPRPGQREAGDARADRLRRAEKDPRCGRPDVHGHQPGGPGPDRERREGAPPEEGVRPHAEAPHARDHAAGDDRELQRDLAPAREAQPRAAVDHQAGPVPPQLHPGGISQPGPVVRAGGDDAGAAGRRRRVVPRRVRPADQAAPRHRAAAGGHTGGGDAGRGGEEVCQPGRHGEGPALELVREAHHQPPGVEGRLGG